MEGPRVPPSPCGSPGSRLVHGVVAIEKQRDPDTSTPDGSVRAEAGNRTPVSARVVGEIPLGARSDLELVSSLGDPSGDAYSELYRRHSASVTAAVRMILVKDQRCEDVVAEVFVSLWFFPEKFDPARGTLLAYLRLKARGRSIDLVRKEEARTRRETTSWPRWAEAGADAGLVGAESALAVQAALALLPAIEQEPIVLAYFSGLTYTEVALRLGLPEGTVKSRIRSGLSRLQRNRGLRSLRDTGDDTGDGDGDAQGVR